MALEFVAQYHLGQIISQKVKYGTEKKHIRHDLTLIIDSIFAKVYYNC